MVFREETLEDTEDEQRGRGALSRYAGNRTKTGQSFNLVEVPSALFSRHASESSDEADRFLAAKLVELWAARLVALFPEQEFVVETVSAKETGGEQGVVFYTRRDVS